MSDITPSITYNYLTNDPIVNFVISKMKLRSEQGMLTYGVTMERQDISTTEWLQHAQEEALDLAVYLERCIRDLEFHQKKMQETQETEDKYHFPLWPVGGYSSRK
jgi:hypothetical protein